MTRRLARRLTRDWPGVTATAISRLFRCGTPVLVVVCAAGLLPWLLVLVPVVPIWLHFSLSTRDARRLARIVRRPDRAMSLDELAAERELLQFDAKFQSAEADRKAALLALARERLSAEADAPRSSWRRQARTLAERTGLRA